MLQHFSNWFRGKPQTSSGYFPRKSHLTYIRRHYINSRHAVTQWIAALEPAADTVAAWRSEYGGVLLLFMKAVLRWCCQFLFAVLVVLAAVWGSGEASQWILRWRAEKLLSDVRTLEVGRSGWPEVQQTMNKWGRWGAPKDSCSATSCTYSIDLQQTLPSILGGSPGDGAKNWLPRLLNCIGLRSAAARAGFTMQHGVVSEKWFGEQVTLPVRDWSRSVAYVPYLSVSSHSTVRFHDHTRDPDQIFTNRLVRAYPYGLNASFSPDEEASEQAMLMDFQFFCITQLAPCEDVADILPEGWRTLQMEQQQQRTR